MLTLFSCIVLCNLQALSKVLPLLPSLWVKDDGNLLFIYFFLLLHYFLVLHCAASKPARPGLAESAQRAVFMSERTQYLPGHRHSSPSLTSEESPETGASYQTSS